MRLEVDERSLQMASEVLMRNAAILKSAQYRLMEIREQRPFEDSASAQYIRRSLDRMSDELAGESKACRNLATGLQKVSREYRTTEERVIARGEAAGRKKLIFDVSYLRYITPMVRSMWNSE